MHTLTYGMLHQYAYRPLPTTKTLTDLKNAYLLLVSIPPRKRLLCAWSAYLPKNAYLLTKFPVAIDHSNARILV